MRTKTLGKRTLGLLMIAAALAAGCARTHDAPVQYTGSIKDTSPAGYAEARHAKSRPPKATTSPAKSTPAAAQPPESSKPAVTAETTPPPSPATPMAAPPVAMPEAQAPEVRPTETLRSSTPPPPVTANDDRATSRQLLEEGRKLFAEGKVVDARRRFIAALTGASPEATWALAQTFDSHYLALLPAHDGIADPERALTLYKTAIERGAKAAQDDIDRIMAAGAPSEKPKQ